MERCSYKKEACSAKGQKIEGVWVCDNHLVAYEVEQQRATHPDQSADAQATVEALQRERDELKELTNVICGHCCEPMAIPSRAVLQAALRRAKAEGLKEAEQYALNCVKELQDKIKDIELDKYTLVGAQTKEGVAEWVHAKTLQASRIAKWITARIAEVEIDARAAQIEEGA